MFLATTIVSLLLAGLLAYAAARKLSHSPQVVAAYARVGVPEHRLDHLAAILLAGAGGLLAGLLWAPIGIAAALALICYFLVAVGAHLRHDDVENLPTPLAIAGLAAAALALRLMSS